MVARPTSIEELAEFVRRSARVRLSLGGWDLDPDPGDGCLLAGLTGIVEISPSDMVATVRAGTILGDLQSEVAEYGLCLPHSSSHLCHLPSMTLADLIALNLPHGLDAQCGSWRDWVLGMKLILADGTICTSGSKVVKSVAGYDVHKLIIGARHTLAVVAEVTLRLFPISARPPSEVVVVGPSSDAFWVHRVRPTDFAGCLASHGDDAIAYDPCGCTVWANANAEYPVRFLHDVLIGHGLGGQNLEISDPVVRCLILKAKSILDPTSKLNPDSWAKL